MKTRALIVIAATSFCMGCANISTLNRTTTLPSKKGEVNGLAIHLDAPQRLVFSKDGIVCAEPSPDALQAYAASQALSVDVPSEAEIKFANALAASAGSIGLRTQSITLMRDHLFRICEAAYSGLLTEFDVAQLIRRSQDLTLGVLAIEQLSGAVKAQQVAMNPKANADASANLAATEANLAAAREKERLAEKVAVAAEEKKTAQATLLTTKQDLTAKPPAGQDPIKLQEDIDKEKKQLALVTTEAADAKKNQENKQEVTKQIEENLGKAMITATDAAKGESKSSGGKGDSGIDSNTAKTISEAAVKIVEKIVDKDHTVDSCISLLNKFAKSELEPRTQHSVEEKLKAEIELKTLYEKKQNVTDLKNAKEREKIPAETKLKLLELKLGETETEDRVKQRQKINALSVEIGQLHEKRQDFDQQIISIAGSRLIREQCMAIIKDHLERERERERKQRELESRGNGGENGKKK